MPNLKIDDFPKPPKVGDKINVKGKVLSIDEDSGDVEVSYDDITFVNKKDSSNPPQRDNNGYPMDQQMAPNTQTLDEALNTAFNKTQ